MASQAKQLKTLINMLRPFLFSKSISLEVSVKNPSGARREMGVGAGGVQRRPRPLQEGGQGVQRQDPDPGRIG